MIRILSIMSFFVIVLSACGTVDKQGLSKRYTEQYRPQYHFTPDSMWMNDPNGMVYYEGEYHLFYQYYPNDNVWGPMHWGHAISEDLMHWEHQPIAIYPDTLGWIFSGSAVVDWKNTSGLGTNGNPPMIAIFTQHYRPGEEAGLNDFQTQGIAYSNDKGRSWDMFDGNPVLSNPGINDFRDPKVIWYEAGQKWIMSLAVKDQIGFYSSSDLKTWEHESDFGLDVGAHGGVWECPDLFPIKDNLGNEKWILLVSINPGGPSGGSATQYFIGDFDGSVFQNQNPSTEPIWFDWGKDNYAGVTWSDVPEQDGRRIFIGWMSNWQYATSVPTQRWRSAMTTPREIKLVDKRGSYQLNATPVKEVEVLFDGEKTIEKEIELTDGESKELFVAKVKGDSWKASFILDITKSNVTTINVINGQNQISAFTFNVKSGSIGFDRMNSGSGDFNADFMVPINGDYVFDSKKLNVDIYWDASSMELFVNDGEFQMTNLVFPSFNWNAIEVVSIGSTKIKKATYSPIKTVWR